MLQKLRSEIGHPNLNELDEELIVGTFDEKEMILYEMQHFALFPILSLSFSISFSLFLSLMKDTQTSSSIAAFMAMTYVDARDEYESRTSGKDPTNTGKDSCGWREEIRWSGPKVG